MALVRGYAMARRQLALVTICIQTDRPEKAV